MFLGMIPTAANIPLYLALIGKGVYKNPNIFNDFLALLEKIVLKIGWTWDLSIATRTITIIVYVLVGLFSLALLSEFGKIIRLGAEGFPEKEVRIYR